MKPEIFGAALAVAAIVTMLAGAFLLINARVVVRMFRSEREAGPKEAASWSTNRRQVKTALGAFLIGLAVTLGIYVLAIAKAGT